MIITVSREFGSGGRELGKRLSDTLHIPCYDNEIITMIANESGFDENYIAHLSEKNIRTAYPLTIGRRFTVTPDYATQQAMQVIGKQHKIIEQLAKQGNCVIVGRCADIILKSYHPFNIFVYADKASKIQRCMERATEGELLTASKIERKMREIDKGRANHRQLHTDTKWGAKENYHLCVNTSGIEMKSLVSPLADYIKVWFENKNDEK